MLREYSAERKKEVVTIMIDIFDEEHIMKTFARSERHDEARETAARMIKLGKVPLDEIAICLPSLSMRELKELEAEISAESMADS